MTTTHTTYGELLRNARTYLATVDYATRSGTVRKAMFEVSADNTEEALKEVHKVIVNMRSSKVFSTRVQPKETNEGTI